MRSIMMKPSSKVVLTTLLVMASDMTLKAGSI